MTLNDVLGTKKLMKLFLVAVKIKNTIITVVLLANYIFKTAKVQNLFYGITSGVCFKDAVLLN